MPTIRAPAIDELSDLSDLCFRSNAVWGYDSRRARPAIRMGDQQKRLPGLGALGGGIADRFGAMALDEATRPVTV